MYYFEIKCNASSKYSSFNSSLKWGILNNLNIFLDKILSYCLTPVPPLIFLTKFSFLYISASYYPTRLSCTAKFGLEIETCKLDFTSSSANRSLSFSCWYITHIVPTIRVSLCLIVFSLFILTVLQTDFLSQRNAAQRNQTIYVTVVTLHYSGGKWHLTLPFCITED